MARDSDSLAIVSRGTEMTVCDTGHPSPYGPGRGARSERGLRVAFYSHDTQGLGHVRRNSLLAAAMVAADPATSALLVSGAREAAALPLPDRTEVAVVPEVAKNRHGGYSSRRSLRSLDHVVALRTAALERALVDFAPHLLVVDKVSRGFGGELEQTLRRLRREHGTRTVLGLRDVLDDVETTQREWERSRTPDAIVSLYDQVWVYGDPAVFDPAEEYGWTDPVRARIRYTGYLGSGRERLLPSTHCDRACGRCGRCSSSSTRPTSTSRPCRQRWRTCVRQRRSAGSR